MKRLSAKLHQLWETHELHMEVAVLAVALTTLSLLVFLPRSTSTPTDGIAPLEIDIVTDSTLPIEAITTVTSPGSYVSTPDTSLERALIDQNITKTTREISEIQQSSLAITALIQKECGAQTNDCAKKLQSSLAENAREYERAQERLKALTASLGNLD